MTRLLVINPGSTSTKFGIFHDGEAVFLRTLRHGEELLSLPGLKSQLPVREQLIREALEESGQDLASLDAVIGRGGLLHPLEGGVYEVSQDMKDDLESCRYGWHASNLGGVIAPSLARSIGRKAYIADPVIVDELEPLARLTGWPAFSRKSIFHALNQKAVARRYATETGGAYEDLNLIVAHLGGGISVGAHTGGRVIDVNNALSGEGPFSPERTGSLPFLDLMELCFSGRHSLDELKNLFIGRGGLTAWLGTSDAAAIDRRIEAGDEKARLVLEAMSYQVAKAIGGAAAVLKGRVDALILTGGLAYDPYIVDWIKERVSFIAPIKVYPGEDELAALADTAGRALKGELPIKTYRKEGP